MTPVRLPASGKLNGVRRIRARWIVPVDQPPVENGIVEVDDGWITGVCRKSPPPDQATLDLGNAALLPALVNAHAHLEFADCPTPVQPPVPFASWIRNLLAHRRERTLPVDELVADGLSEAAAGGTGLVGEIAATDWSPSRVAEHLHYESPTVVAFREILGLLPEQAAEQIALAQRHVAECRQLGSGGPPRLLPALSPHAPYSVSFDLFLQSVDLAGRERIPLCIHLAETPAELELLRGGTGELVQMLSEFGLWHDGLMARGRRPMDYLEPLASLDNALIAHGNCLADDEIAWLGRHPNVATVYCPRTHAFFGHQDHPWKKLIAAGATVCLGTDGRSSSPDYSLWSDLEFLTCRSAGLPETGLLELATLAGARALGVDSHYGSLTAGKRADFCVVDLTDSAAASALKKMQK